ncbi:amino acid racemase [Actinoallomurus vinaceus]|uniref:Amino acid racemase n=2 Tax=Thermomonosporaceae TaxID=2012 RepID=A0ABP8UVH0_9ACTN
MGPAATAEFMRLLTAITPAQRDQDHPRVLVLSDTQIPDRRAAFGGGDDPTPWIRSDLFRLARWGADLLAMPCNTAHLFVEGMAAELPKPLVHIAEATITQAYRRSPRGGLLVATGATVRSGLYQQWARRLGYRLVVPPPDRQEAIDVMIDLVKAGQAEEAARSLAATLEEAWQERDLPMVAACTEVPLAYDLTGLPDDRMCSSLEALAEACLQRLNDAACCESAVE